MSYKKRLDHAFEKASTLPITYHTRYVFFSDCHRGSGDNNDNFLHNSNNYLAALQHYYQYDFCYIEVGDGDELWENRSLSQISEIHDGIFSLLCQFNCRKNLYMLYGNHDIVKRYYGFSSCAAKLCDINVYESLILESSKTPISLYVTHGHQADYLNSSLWRIARFLVRYIWSPLEFFGFNDPTSAAKNNYRKNIIEKRLTNYAKSNSCMLLTGHTHRPTLGDTISPYCNCGSCVHPMGITCIELCGHKMNLVKWRESTLIEKQKDEYYYNSHSKYSPEYPVYVKREVLASLNLLDVHL